MSDKLTAARFTTRLSLAALCRADIAIAIAPPTLINFNHAVESAKLDDSVGIAHAALAGTAHFRLHVTKLMPGAKVKAHRHDEDYELYIIHSGVGHLYTGLTDETGLEKWFAPVPVEAGVTFSVSPRMLHQLHNTGDTPLILIFGCPDSHLSSDRVVVDDFPLNSFDQI